MKNKTLIIVFLSDDKLYFTKGFSNILKIRDADILVVDDASEAGTEDADNSGVVFIKHSIPLGFGGCFSSGLRYAQDMGYDIALFLDTDNGGIQADVEQMRANMSYGYDIVSCSRILENREAESFSKENITVMETISEAVSEASGFDLTDPLSGILAVKTSALSEFELTEEGHGALLQLWIQAAYFQLAAIELPSASGKSFGRELKLYDDPLGELLTVLETEKYLYPKRV